MTARIPDLWRAGEDVSRLYKLYLARLLGSREYERMVVACRQIRRYAARDPDSRDALFTYPKEFEALCALNDYQGAWRQLRRFERAVHGKQWDLVHREWTSADAWALKSLYAPLLYFRGHHRLGCTLLESALDFWFCSKTLNSYDVLFDIYNGEEHPSHWQQVTLSHFYNRLGHDLCEWRHWEKFVNNLHPRFLRVADLRREQLINDPAQLSILFDRLMEMREERTISGITSGQSDLIESAEKVRQRQEKFQRERDEFGKWNEVGREQRETKLVKLFPELADLPE